MKSAELPFCEWPNGKTGPRFCNCCDADEELMVRAAERRIQQITKQLECPHGLTNKERAALANERSRFGRWLEGKRPGDTGKRVAEAARLKAAGKKLGWLSRKIDRLRENT